jgi:hypothetical protein
MMQYVEYGSVRYPIIYRNPPLIDDEGYEIDSDDDDERVGEAVAFATEVNPYSNVHLERMLSTHRVHDKTPDHNRHTRSPNLRDRPTLSPDPFEAVYIQDSEQTRRPKLRQHAQGKPLVVASPTSPYRALRRSYLGTLRNDGQAIRC